MDAAEPPGEHLSRLMARAQQGDQAAYVTLLRAVTPHVRQLVRRKRAFLGESDVEDVVQEVLLSIHAVRATYDPRRPFMPWVAAIVRHRLADAARQHARQGAHEIIVDDLDVTFGLAQRKGKRRRLAIPRRWHTRSRPCRRDSGRLSNCSSCTNSR